MLGAGCTQPQTAHSSAASAGDSSSGSIQVATPGAAEKMGKADDTFPAVPAGYRGLGSVLLRDNAIFIITPQKGQPDSLPDDMTAGLAHNMAVGTSGVDSDNRIAAADCQGSGETPESAIQVLNLAGVSDQVRYAHACARLRHPGTTWVTTQLVAKEDNYISQIVLRDGSRNAVVYVDVNRYVKQVLSEVNN
jgi:hypothetical protein